MNSGRVGAATWEAPSILYLAADAYGIPLQILGTEMWTMLEFEARGAVVLVTTTIISSLTPGDVAAGTFKSTRIMADSPEPIVSTLGSTLLTKWCASVTVTLK